MDEAAQDAALGDTELTDLWGVAARLTWRLVAVGIKTPLDWGAARFDETAGCGRGCRNRRLD